MQSPCEMVMFSELISLHIEQSSSSEKTTSSQELKVKDKANKQTK